MHTLPSAEIDQIFQHHTGIALDRPEYPNTATQTHIHRNILQHSLPHLPRKPNHPPNHPPHPHHPLNQPPRHLQNLLPKCRMLPPLPRIRRFSHRIQHPRHLIADQTLCESSSAFCIFPYLFLCGGEVCEGGGEGVEVSLLAIIHQSTILCWGKEGGRERRRG